MKIIDFLASPLAHGKRFVVANTLDCGFRKMRTPFEKRSKLVNNVDPSLYTLIATTLTANLCLHVSKRKKSFVHTD